MMRGVNRYKAEHVSVEQAAEIVVTTFLNGSLARKRRD
jgi:hypothetical protein